MNDLQLTAEQIDELDRLDRSMLLNTRWTVHVLAAEDPRALRPALVHVLGACLRGAGETFEVRHFDHEHDDDAVAAIDAAIERASGARLLIIMDFSQLAERDDARACDFFTQLNGRRDTMRTHLRGELIVAIPGRVEQPMLAAAPDLSSGVRSLLLRRGAFDERAIEQWRSSADQRFEVLLEATPGAEQRYRHGTFTFAYCFEPGTVDVPLADLRAKLTAVEGYTGWRPWWVPTVKFAPQMHDGALECWMFGPEQLFDDPAHSDFWRVSPHGELYLRRGYQEDSQANIEPGQLLSLGLPIWRAAEVMLHVDGFARQLGLPRHLRVGLSARWTGLAGRVLSTWPDRFEDRLGTSEEGEAHVQLVFTLSQLPEQIEPLVGRIVAPLLQRFNPTQLATKELLSTQIRLLRERRAS